MVIAFLLPVSATSTSLKEEVVTGTVGTYKNINIHLYSKFKPTLHTHTHTHTHTHIYICVCVCVCASVGVYDFSVGYCHQFNSSFIYWNIDLI